MRHHLWQQPNCRDWWLFVGVWMSCSMVHPLISWTSKFAIASETNDIQHTKTMHRLTLMKAVFFSLSQSVAFDENVHRIMNQPHYFVKNHQKFWCSISLARLLRINSIDCWMKKIPTKRSNALTDSDDAREEWEGKKTYTHTPNPIHTPALFPTFHCEWCMDAKVASAFLIVVDVSFWPNLRVRTLFLSLSFSHFFVISPLI